MRRLSEEHVSDLKRILLRLGLLDGRLLWCVEGPQLTWLQDVHDPLAVLDELARHGRPTVSGLQRAARMLRAPYAVDARWLGAAQRDLKALRHPSALALIAESPRVFRRHGRVDAAWLDARQHALDALSRQLAAGPTEGAASLYALVEAIHGPGATRALERLELRSRQHGRFRRAEGRRRIAALVSRLSPAPRVPRPDACEVPDELLDGFARELLLADRARGRPFERRLRRTVWSLMAWPERPPDSRQDLPPAPLPPALEDAVRAVGEKALAVQRPTTHHDAPERLGRALGVLGLMFRPEAEDRLTPSEVSLTLRSVEKLREHLAGRRLTVRQALELLRLDERHGNTYVELLPPLGALVAGGLELSLVSTLVRSKHASGLVELKDDVDAARTWGQWVLRLSPLLKDAKNDMSVNASAFRGIARSRTVGLTLLGRCLLAQRPGAAPESMLAWLDATLGLVHFAPEQARSLHADLTGTSPGLGRRLFPEFAAWLGEESLLDRYCHLRQLAGESPSLPRALLRDFTHASKRQREREHLASREGLTDAQRRRLERLEQRPDADAVLPSPDWTLRRLRERVDAAWARAFEVRLDAALAAVLRAGWGICLPVLPPEWRDAARFQLSTDDNRELLGTLLRHAAAHPGQPLARAMPANAAWLKRAAKRMDVEAWLAPHRAEVSLQGRRYVLTVEQDPLQVLRMGIPFNTCLSLERGSNAAATVLNALDANKRVLYLRDEAGQIVARKLIAVSRDWMLLGYRLYVALEPGLRPDIERAFYSFCAELAARCRLPLASVGEPESLHPGFWHDDGTVPFTTPEPGLPERDAVAAYCHHLGRPVGPPEDVQHEAAVWLARHREDVAATLSALGRHCVDEADLEAAHWLVERLSEAECLRLSVSHPPVGAALLHRAFTPDAARMLAMLRRFPQVTEAHWEEVKLLLDLAMPSEAAARLLVDVARRQKSRSVRFNDHGIEHGTMEALPPILARLEVATALELCNQIAPVWDWGAAQDSHCDACRDRAWRRVTEACVHAYSRRPDAAAVVRCLADDGLHPAVHRVALRLAARFPFPRSPRAPAPVPRGLTWFEGAPIGCPLASRVLRARCARDRELAVLPDMLAALLRQSGPDTPGSPGPLPEPTAAPFEALADLQLHLPELTRGLLARWDGVPTEDSLSTWTLYFHRRHATAWKRALTRRGEERLKSRRGWLAVLGDTRGLQAVFEQPPPDTNEELGPALPSFTEGWRDSRRIARLVARQVMAGEDASDAPRELEGNVPPEAVDPALVRRALRALDAGTRPEALADGGGEALAPCIGVLARAELDLVCWVALLEQLLDRGAPDALVAGATTAAFSSENWGVPEDTEGLLVRLSELPGTRRAVVELLCRLSPLTWASCHARLQLEARARGRDVGALLDEVCAGWVRRLRSTEPINLPLRLPAGLLDGLERAALAQGALVSLRLYDALPGRGLASRFLDRMLAALPLDVLREELAAIPREVGGRDGLQRGWLDAALGVTAGDVTGSQPTTASSL